MDTDVMTRRNLVIHGGLAAASAALAAAPPAHRKMTISLSPGSIGVKGNQLEVIEMAHRHGFEAVEPQSSHLITLSNDQLRELAASLKSKQLQWGAAGLPLDFRTTADKLAEGLRDLPRHAKALQIAGVTRVGTWISPTSDTLTYARNMKQHGERLRYAANILGDHGLRLGLEYVGPKTSWTARRYPFVHSLHEMRDLIGEIARPNVGFLLDSWHWYTAGDTAADLETVKGSEVVCCDLNDAPAGVAVNEQIDSKRELPAATGVIDVKTFLSALQKMGFDGPIRCEPFNAPLRAMAPEDALAATITSMKKAFATIGG